MLSTKLKSLLLQGNHFSLVSQSLTSPGGGATLAPPPYPEPRASERHPSGYHIQLNLNNHRLQHLSLPRISLPQHTQTSSASKTSPK